MIAELSVSMIYTRISWCASQFEIFCTDDKEGGIVRPVLAQQAEMVRRQKIDRASASTAIVGKHDLNLIAVVNVLSHKETVTRYSPSLTTCLDTFGMAVAGPSCAPHT